MDGIPAGIRIDMPLIRSQLDRRAGRTGCPSAEGISPRAGNETDQVEWLSGVLDGVTLGTPVAFIIRNTDARPQDYDWLKHNYRIGHADFTYARKYGIRDHRGGGRASARETAARVVAGTIAGQLLSLRGIHIRAQLIQVGNETRPEHFREYITAVRRQGDSIGGIIRCVVTGLPVGIGDPVFDKVQSRLAYAVMSINGCKGFDYGSGFADVALTGSQMYLPSDPAAPDAQRRISGGLLGGIADGTPLSFRCVFKPTASNPQTLYALQQQAAKSAAGNDSPAPAGRHDACIAVRAVPVVEAMTALTLIDFFHR